MVISPMSDKDSILCEHGVFGRCFQCNPLGEDDTRRLMAAVSRLRDPKRMRVLGEAQDALLDLAERARRKGAPVCRHHVARVGVMTRHAGLKSVESYAAYAGGDAWVFVAAMYAFGASRGDVRCVQLMKEIARSGPPAHDLLPQWIYLRAKELGAVNWFGLTDSLFTRFLLTDLRGVRPADIRPPFSGFYLELPLGAVELHHSETGWHPLQALAVGLDLRTSLARELTEQEKKAVAEFHHFAADSPLLERTVLEAASRSLHITTICGPSMQSPHALDDNIFRVTLPLGGDDSLDKTDAEFSEAVQEHIQQIGEAELEGSEHLRIWGVAYDGPDSRKLLKRIVMNFILYLNTPNADVRREVVSVDPLLKSYRKGRLGLELLRDMLGSYVTRVGTNVVVDKTLQEAVRTHRVTRSGWKLVYRTLVRGHWRNQACGPGSLQRKLIWIEPHARGPGEHSVGHDYSFKQAIEQAKES